MSARNHQYASFLSALVATLLLVLGGEASATTSCTTTVVVYSGGPGVVSGTFKLQDDYATTNDGAPCFDVRDGIDLDTNGHSISCTDASCLSAVTCADANTRVRSTISNDGAHIDISGPFSTGVLNCSDHEDLAIDGSAYAISSTRADLVENNVLTHCSSACVSVTMESGTDRIHDNLIKPYGGDGISIVGRTSATGPKIDHNLVLNFDVGVYNNDTTYVRIEDNVLGDGAGTNIAYDINTLHKSGLYGLCEGGASDPLLVCTYKYIIAYFGF